MDASMSHPRQRVDAQLELDLRQQLALQLNRSLAQVTGNARLIEELGMDSLELAELLVVLESRHGITLPLAAISRLDTVDALLLEVAACLPLPQ